MYDFRPLVPVLALTVCGLAVTGCESARSTVSWQANGMPRHEHPHQDWWHFQFVYYPNAQAYYEPYSQSWFWFENGSWWNGEALPRGMAPSASQAVVVRTRWDLPFLQHDPTMLSMHHVPVDPALRFDPRRTDPFVEQIVSFPVFASDGVD